MINMFKKKCKHDNAEPVSTNTLRCVDCGQLLELCVLSFDNNGKKKYKEISA